ncbi:hypothetical protein PRIPAC_74528 [Pristionchus pacificus]|nr:hypothetical protein PRIPAC_74528 [Pristionchus pacificus]
MGNLDPVPSTLLWQTVFSRAQLELLNIKLSHKPTIRQTNGSKTGDISTRSQISAHSFNSTTPSVKKKRCAYFPLCMKAHKGDLFHPTEKCSLAAGLLCDGLHCLFIHGRCPNDGSCTNLTCIYEHYKSPPVIERILAAKNQGYCGGPEVMQTKDGMWLQTSRPASGPSESKKRCAHFPKCTTIHKGNLFHPTETCRKLAAGQMCAGLNCLYIHGPCANDGSCTSMTCIYEHYKSPLVIERRLEMRKKPRAASLLRQARQGRESQGTLPHVVREGNAPRQGSPVLKPRPYPGTRIATPPPAYEELIGEITQNKDHSVHCEVYTYDENGFHPKFKIEDILGEGTYGIVFQSKSIGDGLKYAVKRISVESCDINKLKDGLREVIAMTQLDYPGIVRYKNSWMENPPMEWQLEKDFEIRRRFPSYIPKYRGCNNTASFVYIQMELCMYSLADWLKNRQDGARIFYWFNQIVSAVAYIHDRGIFHRDLKPRNILFSDPDTLKICDLGIATARTLRNGEELTSTYTSIGTPLYMAPEQTGGNYKSKVDIFALGLILAELCVSMTEQERSKTFKKYREGKPNDFLKNEPDTADFISWLTRVDPKQRPNCDEILQHDFLTSKNLSS